MEDEEEEEEGKKKGKEEIFSPEDFSGRYNIPSGQSADSGYVCIPRTRRSPCGNIAGTVYRGTEGGGRGGGESSGPEAPGRNLSRVSSLLVSSTFLRNSQNMCVGKNSLATGEAPWDVGKVR